MVYSQTGKITEDFYLLGHPAVPVYLLDGGVTFPLLSAYYHYLLIGEELPELILVGISYGSDRFAEGNYRASDFTAPADDREWWGGAPRFQAMLEGELLGSLRRIANDWWSGWWREELTSSKRSRRNRRTRSGG